MSAVAVAVGTSETAHCPAPELCVTAVPAGTDAFPEAKGLEEAVVSMAIAREESCSVRGWFPVVLP